MKVQTRTMTSNAVLAPMFEIMTNIYDESKQEIAELRQENIELRQEFTILRQENTELRQYVEEFRLDYRSDNQRITTMVSSSLCEIARDTIKLEQRVDIQDKRFDIQDKRITAHNHRASVIEKNVTDNTGIIVLLLEEATERQDRATARAERAERASARNEHVIDTNAETVRIAENQVRVCGEVFTFGNNAIIKPDSTKYTMLELMKVMDTNQGVKRKFLDIQQERNGKRNRPSQATLAKYFTDMEW